MKDGNLNDTVGPYVYDLWNHTEHANRMVENARASIASGNAAEALDDLRIARSALERATSEIRLAFEMVEAAARASVAGERRST